ncbi:hypothetical protein Zmor_010902 [Zophobas morio]|uniref:Endothelin-converting enzyme 1 n=1 Tax=Zophobas morio TaxID=2755281 RepID=A0AA38ISG5_9CUCU|nr:hypothetical protein Zmor_010902 [Zophobas morio]
MDNYAYQPDDNGKPFAITRYPSVSRQNNDYLVEVNSRSKFFKTTKFYKRLTAILTILVLLLLIIVIVLAVLYCTKFRKNGLCTSEECLRSAANLRLSMDFSVDPCDDFYQYTCGRWSKEHPNHGWFPSFSAFSTIMEEVLIATEDFLDSENDDDNNEPFSVKQARNFYKSCMDTESVDNLGLSVVYKYLKEVDLPTIPSLFTKTDQELEDFQFDWLKSEATIKKTFAMDVLIGFFVQPNMYNRSENVMYIGVPVTPCPLPSPFKTDKRKKNEVDYAELRKTVNTNIIKFVLTTFFKNVTSKEPKEEVLEQATEVLINMTLHMDELINNYTDIYETVHFENIKEHQNKISEILNDNTKKTYPQIWEKYITYLFEGVNVTIDFDKDLLYLAEMDEDYLPKVISYIMTTSDVYVELYMWWVTVFAMILNTSSDIAEYILKQTAPFYVGSNVLRSRSLDCCILVNTFMGMAVSYGLADKTFSNKTKPKVEEMLSNIKDSFVAHVNTLTWMDRDTKQATLEKSKEMISFIGYPEWLFDKGALDIYYQGIVIYNDTYLENMMSFVKIFVPSKLEELRKINERNWSTDPTDVNAYNSFPDNSINVPMAILSFPAYNLGLEVLNYGAIGSILGHELTHGFDNTGRKYDKFGNYKKWWTNSTIETFEEKTKCFIKQYDNYTFAGISNHVQGEKTLGENLADNGGVNHAYRAYHRYLKIHGSEPKLPGFQNFTNDQLFFVAFGSIWCQTITLDEIEKDIETDVHSPQKIRVIGTLQNSREFAKAFRCPAGSKMNPGGTKCKVW